MARNSLFFVTHPSPTRCHPWARKDLPLTPIVLASLRETAHLYTTHYSTMIEGNRLEPNQIEVVLKHEGHFPGRKRDEHEVKGYYATLTQVEQWAAQNSPITKKMVQILHALVIFT